MLEPTPSEIKTFVGRGANYYLKAWFPSDPLSLPISGEFNGAAFVGGLLWLSYRKLYFESVVYLGVFVVMQVAIALLLILLMLAFPGFLSDTTTFYAVVGAIPMVVVLALAFFCGTYGNLCYQNKVYKRIEEGRSQGVVDSDFTAALIKSGGVSGLLPVVSMFTVLCVQLVIALSFQKAVTTIVATVGR